MMFDTEESRDKLSYLYKTFRSKLLRSASKYLSDQYLAEDIVEQAFIVADKYLDRLDLNNMASTYGYLWRIVNSQCKNYFKIKKTDFFLDTVDDSEEEVMHGDGGGNPLEEILRMERVDLIREAMKELSEKERMVLELFYMSEMKYVEIGELMGMPTSSVGVFLKRGKEHLKKILIRKGLTE